MNKEEVGALADKVISEGMGVSKEEAVNLIAYPDLDVLCDAADRITKAFHSNYFDSCSIVNARSGMCGEDCKWCAQTRRHSTCL